MAKDTFYFSHDYNARNDEKIKRLIRKHKCTGYGIYWCIVEDLYNNANALELDYDGIAFDLHEDVEVVKSVINDFDLFVLHEKEFGSSSIERRLDERNEKSKKAQKSAFKRWNKDKIDANALQTDSESNAIKERKGKEINKEKEINTLAEQSSAYKNLEESKESIFEFIKTEKPQFIEPYADYWNLFADKYGLAKVTKITDSRKKKFKTRLAEEKFNFLKITKKLTEASDFVLTQKWMTFDWVIFSESNYVKILEGNYDKTAINNEKAININKTPEPEYTNLDGR